MYKIKVSKKIFLERFNLGSVYFCYKGVLTERFVSNKIKSLVFSKNSSQKSFSVLTDDSKITLDLNKSSKNELEYRTAFTSVESSFENKNLIEMSPSLSALVNNLKMGDETRQILSDISVHGMTPELTEKAKKKGFVLYPDEIIINSSMLKEAADLDLVEPEVLFYSTNKELSSKIKKDVVYLTLGQIKHFKSEKRNEVEIDFYYSRGKVNFNNNEDVRVFNSIVAKKFKKERFWANFIIGENGEPLLTASTSKDHLIHVVVEHLEEKKNKWKSLSDKKGFVCRF